MISEEVILEINKASFSDPRIEEVTIDFMKMEFDADNPSDSTYYINFCIFFDSNAR